MPQASACSSVPLSSISLRTPSATRSRCRRPRPPGRASERVRSAWLMAADDYRARGERSARLRTQRFMPGRRIRWANAGRAAAIAAAVLAGLATLPALLGEDEPPPLPEDVGLAGGPAARPRGTRASRPCRREAARGSPAGPAPREAPIQARRGQAGGRRRQGRRQESFGKARAPRRTRWERARPPTPRRCRRRPSRPTSPPTRRRRRPAARSSGSRTSGPQATGERPSCLARMSISCSSTQSPGSRAEMICLRRSARRRRSSGSMVSAR